MTRVTVRIPEEQLERVDALVEAGVFSGRSELLRAGCRGIEQQYFDFERSPRDGQTDEIETTLVADGGESR